MSSHSGNRLATCGASPNLMCDLTSQARANALAKVMSLIAWVAAVLTALNTMGVNVRAVLTFSGVGGVLLGLAGREMLANFIGGSM